MEGLKDKIRKLAQGNGSILEGMLLLAEKLEELEKMYYKLHINEAKIEGYTKGLGESVRRLAEEINEEGKRR